MSRRSCHSFQWNENHGAVYLVPHHFNETPFHVGFQKGRAGNDGSSVLEIHQWHQLTVTWEPSVEITIYASTKGTPSNPLYPSPNPRAIALQGRLMLISKNTHEYRYIQILQWYENVFKKNYYSILFNRVCLAMRCWTLWSLTADFQVIWFFLLFQLAKESTSRTPQEGKGWLESFDIDRAGLLDCLNQCALTECWINQ